MNHKLLHLGALATLLLTAACGTDGVVDGNQADRWRADAPRNPADDTTPVTPDDTDPEPGDNTPDPQPADPTGATRDDAIAVDADSATPGELTEQKAAAWYRFVAGDAYQYAVYTSGSVDTECALFDGARTQAMEEDDDSGEGPNRRIEAGSSKAVATWCVSPLPQPRTGWLRCTSTRWMPCGRP